MLQKTTLAEVTRGIDRFSAIVAFNEQFYGRRNPKPSILADVAYVARTDKDHFPRKVNRFATLVANVLATTDWTSRYGMSYHDTMKLKYAEWIEMQNVLSNAPRPPQEIKLITG